MIKRIFAASLALVMIISFAGCKKKQKVYADETSSAAPVQPVNKNKINGLTGVQDLDPTLENRRPVCIMINNTRIAQPVQCGLMKADIVYETEVEGGETRLMAVYKDISKVTKLGSVRSARYPYIDLALGHDAIYLHHGQDPSYAKPHLNDVDHITVDTNNFGQRIPNGLAYEHTLFGFGDKAWTFIEANVKRSTTDKFSPWVTFAGQEEVVSFAGTVANTVNVGFNFPEIFVYDPANGLYYRTTKDGTCVDYDTKEKEQFKNLFVLNSTIVDYPDGEHRKVYLDGGTGYYAVNGTYTNIKWTKGNSTNGFSFTKEDGTPLSVNVGNSWVFIVNTSTTPTTFQ